MKTINFFFLTLIMIATQGCFSGFDAKHSRSISSDSAPQSQSFQKAQEVLQKNCVGCHSTSGTASYARLDYNNEQDFIANGMIVRGNPEASKLIYRTQGYVQTQAGTPRRPANMPMGATLSIDDFQALFDWVRDTAITGDLEPPQLSIVSPENLSSSEGAVQVIGLCEVNASLIQVTGDIEPLTEGIVCSESGEFVADLELSGALGNKTVYFTQSDVAGNQAQISLTLIKADLTAPLLTINTPMSGFRSFESFPLAGNCEPGASLLQVSGDVQPVQPQACNSQGMYSITVTLSSGLGVKNVSISQSDSANNQSVASRAFERIMQDVNDTTPPRVLISQPAVNTTSEMNIGLRGTCENGASNVQISGDTNPVSVACANSSFQATIELLGTPGNKTIQVSQQDAAGNLGQHTRQFVKIDQTAPLLTIDSPAAGTEDAEGLTIQGRCETGASDIAVGGDVMNTNPTPCQNGQYTVSVRFSTGLGNKTIEVAQQDSSLNVARVTRTFTRIAPPTRFQAAQTVLNNRCIECHQSGGAAGFAPFDFNNEQDFIDAGLVVPGMVDQSRLITRTQGYGGGQSTMPLNASLPSAEFNTLRDWVLNMEDQVAPNIAISFPAAGSEVSETVTLMGTCEAGASDITVAGDVVSTVIGCASNGTFTAPITLSPGVGTKTVTVAQQDLAENVGSDSRNFQRVDNTPPVIMISSPAAGSRTEGDLVLSGTCQVGESAVSVSGDVSPVTPVPCQNNGTFSAQIILSGNDGNKTVTVSQSDSSSNTGTDSRIFEKYSQPELTPEERFTMARNIINTHCLGCHQPGGAAAHASFALNSEVDFVRQGFVVPGEPDQSMIIYRSRHYGGSNSNMPLGNSTYSEADHNSLVAWVDNMPVVESPYSCDPNVSPLASLEESYAKRLSQRQYDNTLLDLFSLALPRSTAQGLLDNAKDGVYIPADQGEHFSRENNALTGDHMEAYLSIAESLSQDLSGTHLSNLVRSFINLDPGACTSPNISNLSQTCRQRFIQNFAGRAFRRPLRLSSDNLTTESGEAINEMTALQAEFSGVSLQEGVQRLIIRVLISPHFLFQIEDQNLVAGATNESGVYRLSDYAIISRLAYRFWNTMPDTQLWNIARSQDLTTDQGYNQALNHILSQNQKLDGSLREFYNEWLKLESIPQFSNNPQLDIVAGNVNYGPNLRRSMINELEELGSFVTTAGGTFDDLFTTDISFARDPELMEVYNVNQAAPMSFTPENAVRLPATEDRAGLLTRAALLISGSELTNPILRGAHLRKDILCLDLGSPPDNALDEFNSIDVDFRLSTREKTQIKTSGPSCVSCHRQINPIGFAFSNFNSIGAFGNQEPIFNDSGQFTGNHVAVDSQVDLSDVFGPGTNATGAAEMSALVASQTSTKTCFNEKVFTFFYSRQPDPQQDACRLEQTYQSLSPNSSLIDMVRQFGQGADLRYRRISN